MTPPQTAQAPPPQTVQPPVAPGPAEFKQVTVLFADLVSSTEIIATLDAEQAMERLRPVVDAMSKSVQRFGGTVFSTLGDGIMALFGVPYTQEGHAVLACQAALAMRATLKADHTDLAIRVGLHSGEVVADATLHGHDLSYRAFGLALHLASRLTHQAESGSICISEACCRLVRAFCDVEPLGPRTLRGLPQPIALYTLTGMTRTRSRPSLRGTLTPFLGRRKQMAALKRALLRTKRGAGAIASVIGAPGAGKSRLCHEFTEFCRTAGIPAFTAYAQPYGTTVPLRPIADLLRAAYFALSPEEPPERATAAITTRLSTLPGTVPPDIGLVCELLGVPGHDPPPAFLSPGTRTTRLLEIVRALVRQHPATAKVLVLEDLHWLDQASETFLAALARAIPGTRTMLLVNTRPANQGAWMQSTPHQPVELEPFTRSSAALLVDQLVGAHAGLADIRGRVAARSGGNPFFAEELVRSLVDEGTLIGHLGAYAPGTPSGTRTDPSAGTGYLPSTVQAVIGARIDRLAPSDRKLLQVAAVIGREFDLPVLQAVLQPVLQPATGETAATLSAVERLCLADLLTPADRPGGPRYEFRHPLIRDVAYATQLKAQRSTLHAAVAAAMQRVYPARGGEIAGLIAHHLEEAGQNQPAATFGAEAARWIGQTSPAAAITQWRKVRALMQAEPRSHPNDVLRIEANGQIAWLGWREGLPMDQAQPLLQQALEWAHETDGSMVPLLMLVQGRLEQVAGGDADAFVARINHAITLAERHHSTGRIATLQAQLSHAYGWAGLLHHALAANDAALAGASHVTTLDQNLLGYSVLDWTKGLRGRILLRLGRFDEACRSFDETIALQGLIDPTVTLIAHFGYVELAWYSNNAALAAEHTAQIAAMAEQQGSAYLRLYHLATRASTAGIAGAFHEAISGFEAALDFQRQTGAAVEFEPDLLAGLAENLQSAGALPEAAATAERAFTLARSRHARLPQCRALITYAETTLALQGATTARTAQAALAQAQALIEETGAIIYAPRLHQARRQLPPAAPKA